MAHEPNREYTGKILRATMVKSLQKQTPGIEFLIQCISDPNAGNIEHTLYLTANTRENVLKILAELEVDPAALDLPNFYRAPGDFLEDKACTYTTIAETYKDGKDVERTKVKIDWLHGMNRKPRSLPVTDFDVEALRRMFGSTPRPAAAEDTPPWAGEA